MDSSKVMPSHPDPPLCSANINFPRRGLPVCETQNHVHYFSILISYSYFTRKKAHEYGVTGWCRNTVDDTVRRSPLSKTSIANTPTQVEGEAQGDHDMIQKFVMDISEGPSHSNVEKVITKDLDVMERDGTFEVR